MKIRYKARHATADRCYKIGEEREISDDLGRELINGGYAEFIPETKPKKKRRKSTKQTDPDPKTETETGADSETKMESETEAKTDPDPKTETDELFKD
jgi:hypothetical protein